MIPIDEIRLSTQPMDMHAGMDTAMAQVVRAFWLHQTTQGETVALSLDNNRADPGQTLAEHWTVAGDEYAFYRENLNNVMT